MDGGNCVEVSDDTLADGDYTGSVIEFYGRGYYTDSATNPCPDDDDSVSDTDRAPVQSPIIPPPTDPFKRLAYDLKNLFNLEAFKVKKLSNDRIKITLDDIRLSLHKKRDEAAVLLTYTCPSISGYTQDIELPSIDSPEWHDMVSDIANRHLSAAFKRSHNAMKKKGDDVTPADSSTSEETSPSLSATI